MGFIDCYDELGCVVEIKICVGCRFCVKLYEMIQFQMYLFFIGVFFGYVVELDYKLELMIGKLFRFDDEWWNNEVVLVLIFFRDDLVMSMRVNLFVDFGDIIFVDEY